MRRRELAQRQAKSSTGADSSTPAPDRHPFYVPPWVGWSNVVETRLDALDCASDRFL